MAEPKRQVVSAGLLIFRRCHANIEFVFLQSSRGPGRQDHRRIWTPPKGHVEPGETELEAAWRETKEEAGYTTEDLTLFQDFQKSISYALRNNRTKRVEYWLAELKISEKPVTLSAESSDFKWVQLDGALELNARYPDMQRVVKSAGLFIQNLGQNTVE